MEAQISSMFFLLLLLLLCVCVFFLNLVCDPKLILQISGTLKFQETYTCRKLHRKKEFEEVDNAVKELLSKLSGCCDELGKIDH